jgi:hypothetical protein
MAPTSRATDSPPRGALVQHCPSDTALRAGFSAVGCGVGARKRLRYWRLRHWRQSGFVCIVLAACGGHAGNREAPSSKGAPPGNGSATPPGAASCEDPWIDTGGGWQACANGLIHRAAAARCPSSLPRPDPLPALLLFEQSPPHDASNCQTDSDCAGTEHGHCEFFASGTSALLCVAGCVTDDECAGNEVCLCGDPVGSCVPANCRLDSDCGGDLLCANYVRDPRCAPVAFACQSGLDLCEVDGDCGGDAFCTYESTRLCRVGSGCLD